MARNRRFLTQFYTCGENRNTGEGDVEALLKKRAQPSSWRIGTGQRERGSEWGGKETTLQGAASGQR